MNKGEVVNTKFRHNQEVYIRKGYYRGYKANILDYEVVTTKEQETSFEKTTIIYKLKVQDLKDFLYLAEEYLIPYHKYIIF
jgi:uncharacterized protein (UPF0248 family)